MALDNIQTIDRDLSVKKEDKDKTIYSINLKPSTVEKARGLLEKRESLMQELNANISDSVQNGETTEQLVGKNIVLAANIKDLERKINILVGMQGPVEARGQRAIRLIKKMYDEAVRKSSLIYPASEKTEENEVVPETTPVVVEVPTVNVQQIAVDNGQAVGQSIENAIGAEENNATGSLEVPTTPVVVEPTTEVVAVQNPQIPTNEVPVVSTENVVEPVVSAVVEPTVVEVPTTPVTNNPVDLEEQNRINNETMKNYANEAMINVEPEKEYIPMTIEEIIESQRKLAETAARSEEARYQRLIAEEARKAKEVEAINESKGFDFTNVAPIEIETEPEKALRDDIIVAPERDIFAEEKINKDIEEKKEEPVLVEEEKEAETPRWESINISEKESLISHREESIEELATLIMEEQQKQKEKQEAKTKSEEELQYLKEDYDKLIENEKAAEEKLAELKEQAVKKDKELEEAKEELRKRLESIKDSNDSIDADIERNKKEYDSIKEDGDKRNSRLEHLNNEANSVQKNISEIDEMLEKFGSVGENATVVQKTI